MENYDSGRPYGQTCNFDGAIHSLIGVTLSPAYSDPNAPIEIPTTVNDNVNRARRNLPPCIGDPESFGDECEAATDLYLRRNGFDGGLKEFCVVDPGNLACTLKQAITLVEDAKKKEVYEPPKFDFDPSKPAEQLLLDIQTMLDEEKKKHDDDARTQPAPFNLFKPSPRQEYCKSHFWEEQCKNFYYLPNLTGS